MLNPFGSQEDPGSYIDLRKRMFRHVQVSQVDNKIRDAVKNAFEGALTRENIVLSKAEKERLLSQIFRMVLKDMLDNQDEHSGSS